MIASPGPPENPTNGLNDLAGLATKGAAARRAAEQGGNQHLLELAEYLDPTDRSLVRGVWGKSMSASDIARTYGLPATTVRSRINRLAQRLSDPMLRWVVNYHQAWPLRRGDVAMAVFVRGRSHRVTARELGLSLHRVRQEVDRIRFIYASSQKQVA